MSLTKEGFVCAKVPTDGKGRVHERFGKGRVTQYAHCDVRVRVKSPFEQPLAHTRVNATQGVHMRSRLAPW